MLNLARTKLALDEAVAGEDGDSKAEKIMKESLMSTLRRQFVENETGT
jgi:SWI/SNF-related matrix-associated actin-dependent regulator 1 of chromatin subfamily A